MKASLRHAITFLVLTLTHYTCSLIPNAHDYRRLPWLQPVIKSCWLLSNCPSNPMPCQGITLNEEGGYCAPPGDAHRMQKTHSGALYGQSSKCADLRQEFEILTVSITAFLSNVKKIPLHFSSALCVFLIIIECLSVYFCQYGTIPGNQNLLYTDIM